VKVLRLWLNLSNNATRRPTFPTFPTDFSVDRFRGNPYVRVRVAKCRVQKVVGNVGNVGNYYLSFSKKESNIIDLAMALLLYFSGL
jgi:hypothetical protein